YGHANQYYWDWSGGGLSRSGVTDFVNTSPLYFPGLSVFQVDPLPTTTLPGINQRTPAQLGGSWLICSQHTGLQLSSIRSVLVSVTSASDDDVAVMSTDSTQYIEAKDVGAPCVDFATGTLVGLVKTVNATARTATLFRAAGPAVQNWLAGLNNLASLR